MRLFTCSYEHRIRVKALGFRGRNREHLSKEISVCLVNEH
jgi:hypothetical protein